MTLRQAFHERIMKEDNDKKLAFLITNVKKFGINIWDDFLEPGDTYAYVESPHNTYNEFDKDLLTYMYNIIKENTDIQCEVKLVDASEKYPQLLETMSYLLSYRYELHLYQVSYEDIDTIIKLFEDTKYLNVPLIVYTES